VLKAEMIQNQKDKLTDEYAILHTTGKMNREKIKHLLVVWCMLDF
jgi:hypothetical protein